MVMELGGMEEKEGSEREREEGGEKKGEENRKRRKETKRILQFYRQLEGDISYYVLSLKIGRDCKGRVNFKWPRVPGL